MSDGEYELFASQVADVDEEVAEFGDSLPKCGVLFQAQELAAGSECIEEADDGVGDDMLGAYATADDLEGDVKKACLRNLRAYKTRLDVFYGWFQQTAKAGKDLRFGEFARLARSSGVMTRRYQRAKGAALASCKPQ
jgi:hypothetical protein